MEIVLGGYLETALVHYIDAAIRPERNVTTHPYYMCLNRKVPKAFFERCATFVTLADRVLMPSIDWAAATEGHKNEALSAERLTLAVNAEVGGSEWDEDTVALADIVLDNNPFSPESWVHISRFDLSGLSQEARDQIAPRAAELRHQIARQYLCHLLLQLRATAESGAFLALAEPDLIVLRELSDFLARHRLPTPYPIPDIGAHMLDADDFAFGLLNYAPHDAEAMAAVKADTKIQAYMAKVRACLPDAETAAAQHRLLQAMRQAYDDADDKRRAEKIFEVASWCVKPLHYVPVIGEALTLAEDLKDLVAKWADYEADQQEWYLLAGKMADVATRDFLNRKGNQLS